MKGITLPASIYPDIQKVSSKPLYLSTSLHDSTLMHILNLKRVALFSKFCYQSWFQDNKLCRNSCFPISQAIASAMLLIPIVGCDLLWLDVHTNFRRIPFSTGETVQRRRSYGDLTSLVSFTTGYFVKNIPCYSDNIQNSKQKLRHGYILCLIDPLQSGDSVNSGRC
jgi:hypothetical protein